MSAGRNRRAYAATGRHGGETCTREKEKKKPTLRNTSAEKYNSARGAEKQVSFRGGDGGGRKATVISDENAETRRFLEKYAIQVESEVK